MLANTVLVPLDGSVRATAALPVASRLARLLHATVVLLHVGEDPIAPSELLERMSLSDEDILGLVVEYRLGVPADVIVQEAAERHAAMIVMCPQVRIDARSRTFGSVAEAVLCAAPCPVVLVPPARGRKRWELRKVLVPHDGTPASAVTMGPATDFASMAAAELVVLHVATPVSQRAIEPGTLVVPRYIDQPHHEWLAWTQEFLHRLRAVGGGKNDVAIRLAVAQGEAGSAIVEFARQSDFIVLGWRGALEADRALTVRHVIRNTDCPVMMLRLDPNGGRGNGHHRRRTL
jgi:nucleotide-binding universal stress UspA family protein